MPSSSPLQFIKSLPRAARTKFLWRLFTFVLPMCLIFTWAISKRIHRERIVAPSLYTIMGPTMGTTYTVKYVTDLAVPVRDDLVKQIIDDVLGGVVEKMSTYEKSSELSRFNRFPYLTPFNVTHELAMLFERAIKIGKHTGGAFDITIGPVVNAWGFGPEKQEKKILTDAHVSELREVIGIEKIAVDRENNWLIKKAMGMYFDLSGIAKGYGVDLVAQKLESVGIENYMVEIGGEVRVKGFNDKGNKWRIGISQPNTMATGLQSVVELSAMSMATSGDYLNFKEIDGKRFSHIIDPRTLKPIEHRLASVSVVHAECLAADALATAMMVMGLKEAQAFAREYSIPAYFIYRDGEANEFKTAHTQPFEQLFMAEVPIGIR
jgi:thiamine biosynthesis lipoprotein